MRVTGRLAGAFAAAAVACSLLSGCGDDSDSASTATTTAAGATTTAAKATSTRKMAPKTTTEAPSGPNYTIADYIQEARLEETPIQPGTPNAPTIDLPFPPGWENAGQDTPDWAYGAIVYTGPEAATYTPSFIALLSKLEGNVDAQKLIDSAGGELRNLPGFKPLTEGKVTTLSGFPAYQLGGTFTKDGGTYLVAQKTTVIPGRDGMYILQINADGTEDQFDIIGAATQVIDDQTKITP